MKAFTQHTGLVAPLDRANVDTDQIIPKQFLKSIKSFCPILEHRNKRRTRVPLKCLGKLLQLQILLHLMLAYKREGIPILEETPHEKRFSDTSASINYHKLRAFRVHTSLQLSLFLMSSYQSIHNLLVWITRQNYEKISVLASYPNQ